MLAVLGLGRAAQGGAESSRRTDKPNIAVVLVDELVVLPSFSFPIPPYPCALLTLFCHDRSTANPTANPTRQPHRHPHRQRSLGYGDPGFAGHPTNLTPELDKLAQAGKRFNSWYSAYPVCSASRTGVLTGRQPPRVGMVGVINSLSAVGLPLDEITLGNHMQALEYKTLAIGVRMRKFATHCANNKQFIALRPPPPPHTEVAPRTAAGLPPDRAGLRCLPWASILCR